MKSLRSPTEFDQNSRDVTSIPGYVIQKRTAVVEPSTELQKDTRCTTMRSKCMKRTRRHPTILSRRYACDEYRKSLSATGWKEHQHNVIRQNRLGEGHLRRHKSRKNSKFDALDSHDKCIQSTNKTSKRQQFEGNEEYDYAVDPKTSRRFYKGSRENLQTTSSGSRANLQTASSSSSNWNQTQWKTSNWNSQNSSSPDDR